MATNIGTVMSVAAGKPATEDDAGYAALSWEEVEGTLTIPTLGMTQAAITSNLLKSGLTQHDHGTRTIGEKSITFKELDVDAGMDVVRANTGKSNIISFKVEYKTGRIKYFFGFIASLEENEATTETEAGGTFLIWPNSEMIEVDPTP